MAVFHETEAFVARVEGMRSKLHDVLDAIIESIHILSRASTTVENGFRRAEGALHTLATTLENASDVLKRIPAPGPWRVVTRSGASVLDGFGKAIDESRDRLTQVRPHVEVLLRRVQQLLQRVSDVTLMVATQAEQLAATLRILIGISRILQQQQERIEILFPSLTPAIRSQLREWNGALDRVDPVVARAEATLQQAEQKLKDVQGTIDLLAGLDRLRRTVADRIDAVVARVRGAVRVIGELVDRVPFLGRALRFVSSLIDRAMRTLGIDTALQALGSRLAELGLFAKIREFAEEIEESLRELRRSIEALETVPGDVRGQIVDMAGRAGKIVESFAAIGVDKHAVEWLLPRWLVRARPLLDAIRRRLIANPSGGQAGTATRVSAETLERGLRMLRRGPTCGYAEVLFGRMNAPIGKLGITFERMRSSTEPSPAEAGKLIDEALGALDELNEQLAPSAAEGAAHGPNYFDSLYELLSETEVGAEYVAASAEIVAFLAAEDTTDQ